MSSFKSLHVYDDFVWRNRDVFATALFLSVYLLTYVRCVGIALISLQRYITICMSGRRIGKILEEVPAIVYAVIHWLVGFLLTTPLLKSLKATILDRVTVSAISYFFVVRNVLKNQFLRDGTRRQEIRLCIQVAGLLLAFLLLFTYSVGQYILIRKNMMTVLRCWRLSNPLVSGFASWILPWMTLATNTQLRDAFSDMVLCRRERRNTIIMSSAKTSRAQ
ncbi:hypothetical protein Q1695_007109 [Nippostrongylus brasiliensis]|nr:hypothetical protein Q1695_007109 [Nippostrongylus brasiliensis]